MALGDIYTNEQVDTELDKLLPIVNKGKQIPIPRELAKSLLMAENMGDKGGVTFANRRSGKNAAGVAQVIPPTLESLKRLGFLPADFTSDLANASIGEQIHAGLAAMRDLVDRHKTVEPKKIAALYNAGDAGAAKFLKTGNIADLPAETQGYLPKQQRAYEQMGNPLPPTPATVRSSPLFSTTPLQAANEAHAGVEAMMPSVMQALFSGNEQVQQAGMIQKTALAAGAQAAGASAVAQAEDSIHQDQVHGQIMSALGLDVRDPESAISKELQIAASSRAQREQTDAKIAELKGKTLFTDPLGWIMAQPELGALVPEQNRLVDMENSANHQIGKLQTIAAAAKNLTPAKSADLIRAKAQADATMFVKNAEIAAAQISEKNAAGQAKLFLDAMTLQRNRFQDVLALETREAGIEDRNMRRAIYKDATEEKAAAKRNETAFLLQFNAMRKTIAGNVPDMTWDEFKNMPAQDRAMWHEAVARGNYGNSYVDAIPFIATKGNVANAANTGNAAMMQFVRNKQMEAEKLGPEIAAKQKLSNPMMRIDAETQRALGYNELYARDALYANKGVDKGSIPATSPYAVDFDAAAAAAKASTMGTQDSVIASVLLQAKERSPYQSLNATLTPRMMVEAVKAEVLAGKADPAKAAQQLAIFFKTSSDGQYDAIGAKYLGLPKLQDYTIIPGATGDRKIDLFNPTTVENYLTSQVAAQKRRTTALPGELGYQSFIRRGMEGFQRGNNE